MGRFNLCRRSLQSSSLLQGIICVSASACVRAYMCVGMCDSTANCGIMDHLVRLCRLCTLHVAVTALLLSLVSSVLGFTFRPLMTHQRHVRRHNDVNWLQKCLVDLQCPCPLPPGQLPWEREVYDNLLTDVHVVTGGSEPDFLRAILQEWKSTVC